MDAGAAAEEGLIDGLIDIDIFVRESRTGTGLEEVFVLPEIYRSAAGGVNRYLLVCILYGHLIQHVQMLLSSAAI